MKRLSKDECIPLVEYEELEGYNNGMIIRLKEFPNVQIKLEDLFE